MEDGPPGFPQGFSCPVVLRSSSQGDSCLSPTGLITLYGGPFQGPLTRQEFFDSPGPLQRTPLEPYNTDSATPAGFMHGIGLGWFAFARRY